MDWIREKSIVRVSELEIKTCAVLQRIKRRGIWLACFAGLILLFPLLSSAVSNNTVHGDFNGDGFADLAMDSPILQSVCQARIERAKLRIPAQ